jgi:hypothetical protein
MKNVLQLTFDCEKPTMRAFRLLSKADMRLRVRDAAFEATLDRTFQLVIAHPCWSLSTVAAGTPAMLLESK